MANVSLFTPSLSSNIGSIGRSTLSMMHHLLSILLLLLLLLPSFIYKKKKTQIGGCRGLDVDDTLLFSPLKNKGRLVRAESLQLSLQGAGESL